MAVTALNVRIDANRGRSLTIDADLGGAATIGNAVYMASDDDIEEADANAAASAKAIGILVGLGVETPGTTVGAAGDRGTVCVFGLVYGFSSLTPGALLYVSATTGEITHTAPTGAGSWTYAIGYAWDATTVFVQPGLVAPVSNS